MEKGETHTEHDISQDLVFGHLDVADGDTQTKDFL